MTSVRSTTQPTYGSVIGAPTAYASGVKVALLGDSYTNQNNATSISSSNTLTNENSGYFTWANFLLGQPFYFPVDGNGTNLTAANYGVSGDTSALALLRVPTVITYAPDICVVLIGTNDLTASGVTALATTLANLNSIYSQLTAAGILVVAMPIWPRAAWGSLSAPEIVVARKRMYAINDYIRNWGVRNGNALYRVADPLQYITDSGSATGDQLSGYYRSDSIHPGPKAAYYGGLVLSQVLADYSKLAFGNSYSQADLYDATDNTRGNLILNPLLTGTGGTAGTGVSGNVASNWTCTRGSGTGSTVVCNKGATGALGQPGIYQEIAITWDGLGSVEERVDFRQTSNVSTGFAAGDIIEAGCDVAVTGMTGQHMGIQCQLEIGSSGGITLFNAFDMDRYDTSNLMLNVSHSGRFKTPRITVPASPTTLNLRIANRYLNTASGGATIRLSNAWARKVI